MKSKICRRYISLLFFSVIITSCTNEDFIIGRKFLGNDNNIRTIYIDTCSVKLSTVSVDSVKTSNRNSVLAGSFNDPDAGYIVCTSYIPFELPSQPYLPEHDLVFDSLQLVMYLANEWIGDTTRSNSFTLHKLSEPVVAPESGVFYSNHSVPYDAEPLAEFSIRKEALPGDSVAVRLPDDIGMDLFEKLRDFDESVMGSQERFSNYFPGFALTAGDDNNNVLAFSVSEDSSMLLRVYYHYSTWVKTQGFITIEPQSVTSFYGVVTDRSATPFKDLQAFGELPSSMSGNKALLQSLTASYIKIEIPYLNDLLQLGDFSTVVSGALIIYPVRGSFSEINPLPPRLTMYVSDENDVTQGYITSYSGESLQTGNLVIDELFGIETYYTYDITSFIQSQLGAFGIYKRNLKLTVPEEKQATSLNALVAGDMSYPGNRIKLKISYLIYDVK
ncbi:MAG TPA: DUF4270 family protein [Bacteroidales bacterium]|jgi:hypothetical protein|nr:DUF4270 family protein [Bacteroidales bacterium]